MAADSLPVELWMQVFAATRQWRKVSKFTTIPLHSTFIAIASTCSRFHDIVLPMLYEHAMVRLDFDTDQNRVFALPYILDKKPERYQWIKSLVGYWTMPIERDQEILQFREMVCANIKSMIPFLPSLESIHLDRPRITKELLTVIYNCRSLRSLSIHDVLFGPGLIVPLQNLSKELEQKSSLHQLRVTASNPFLTPYTLFFLRIPNLHRIVYTEYSFITTRMSALFINGLYLPWSELRELKFSAMLEPSGIAGLDESCRVLVHAPNLESLVFDAVMWRKEGAVSRSLARRASSVVPKLKEFYRPAGIAPELCKGKAIEKLGLIFHDQVVDTELEDVTVLDFLAGTLLHLTVGNMETEEVNDLINAYPLLQSLEILPTAHECQRTTISVESDYVGQPRQEERSQLEHWAEEHLASLVSTVPHLTRLVVRPFEGSGAIVARRGFAGGEFPDLPEPGPAPEPAEPCIDEKGVLEKSLIPCPDLKDVFFPSLHRWTRYHPTYGWELVERQCGKYDAEDYILSRSPEKT